MSRCHPEQGRRLRIRDREFAWGTRTYVMGIVNVTPDSFSGDGVLDPAQAGDFAVSQIAAGSDLLDIGAESSRPGHSPVDAQAEMDRLIPALQKIRTVLPDAVISVDTHKPQVLDAAHAAGADILNSIWGLPQTLLEKAVAYKMPIVIMHNKSEAAYTGDVMDEVLRFLLEAATRAVAAGVPEGSILIDPGIGFGKTAEHNLSVLRDLHRLPSLGFPTLIGTSRKSTIGLLTQREPQARIYGTGATLALAVAAGIDVVRVHDVAAAKDAVRVADAIARGWRPAQWT